MIPHLSTGHGEDKEKRQEAPDILVVEELKIVSAEIEESADQTEEHEEGDGSGVVGWTKDADMNVRALTDPLGQGLGAEAHPLNVHGIRFLGLSFGWEVHEDGRRVELHDLKDVGSLIKVHHGEEHLVGVKLGVAVRIGHQMELVRGLLADGALPLGRQGREHDDHGVVPGIVLHQVPVGLREQSN